MHVDIQYRNNLSVSETALELRLAIRAAFCFTFCF
jgi:hypothetical protein